MRTNPVVLRCAELLPKDPRYYQIAVLASLLAYGAGWLSFDIGFRQITILLGTVLATQFLCGKFFNVAAFDPRSALISGLSLCLLLRTNSWALIAATAVFTIASKFLFKWNGKHIFNPTNIGHRRDDRHHWRSLGFAGAMGQQTLLRVPHGVPRWHGHPSRHAQRRELRFYFFLCGDPFRARRLAG